MIAWTCMVSARWCSDHYAITVREFLSEVFRDKWIDRGLQQLLMPPEWPPLSSDLLSCDNALWGFIKQKVTQKWCRSTEELKKKLFGMHLLPLLQQCCAGFTLHMEAINYLS
jgi:hypothetical protein